MKKNTINCYLIVSIFCLSFCLVAFSTVSAEEIGQIQTKAGIGFYDSSGTTDSSRAKIETTQSIIATKPKGKLPSTGEFIRVGSSISGLLLIVIVLFLFLKKKKETKSARRER